MYNYNGTDIETSLKGDDMKNVDIVEVREALIEARDGCSEAQNKTSDMKDSAFDASSYADDADNASFDALELVKAAIVLLDGLTEGQEDRIDPEEVKQHLFGSLLVIDRVTTELTTLRSAVFQRAKDWDIRLEGE